ncbi:hypothetical protein N9112_00375 [bacterium]|nr:hypothetical protein [bacterium]
MRLDKRIADITTLRGKGVSLKEISEKYKVDIATVSRFCLRHGIVKNTIHLSTLNNQREYVKKELHRGRPYVSIAKELGVPYKLLLKFCQEKGYRRDSVGSSRLEEVLVLRNLSCSLSEISKVLHISKTEVARIVKNNNMPELKKPRALKRISLNDLKSEWIDIKEPYLVTVSRLPRFYLVPIGD